jgi:hypothetical protein
VRIFLKNTPAPDDDGIVGRIFERRKEVDIELLTILNSKNKFKHHLEQDLSHEIFLQSKGVFDSDQTLHSITSSPQQPQHELTFWLYAEDSLNKTYHDSLQNNLTKIITKILQLSLSYTTPDIIFLECRKCWVSF